MRTHTCGELGTSQLDQTVTLCGWVARRRDHGGLIFVDLRDRYGLTQIVMDPNVAGGSAHAVGSKVRSEFVVKCRGKVRARPAGMVNAKLATGSIEVACDDLEILSEAKTPPFEISLEMKPEVDVAETLRLKYRYLDLRRPFLQRSLILRHQMISVARRHLEHHQFVEVETPILYKSTPEGARDFVVPSRLNPGTFYALPQSPQTLKQLLMISGMDRYYQMARCFRDEDLRADRQPEFSQIDIEASFMTEKEFFPILEGMVTKIWKEILGREIQTPFQQMPYAEAMRRFGSDKPDVRFGLELQDLKPVFEKSAFVAFQQASLPGGAIVGISLEGKAENFSRKDLDDLQKAAVSHGAKGLLWIKILAGGEIQSPAAKALSDDDKKNLIQSMKLKQGDIVFIVADTKQKKACEALGALRLLLAERFKLIPENVDAFLWVTRFPLLEWDDQERRFFACHHPFTSPRPEFFEDFVAGKNLEKIEASAYDMVLNGVEIGGGSLRIYRSDVQDAMFKLLGMSREEAQEKFGFFMEALQYGTPPHGGIAFGIDRLAAQIAGVSAIRDVMAFPKTQRGHCLMSESPSRVRPEQLAELGITCRSPSVPPAQETSP